LALFEMKQGWLAIKLPANSRACPRVAVLSDRARRRRRTARPAAGAAGRHRPANVIYSCGALQVLTCCDAMRCVTSSSRPQCELPCHLDIV